MTDALLPCPHCGQVPTLKDEPRFFLRYSYMCACNNSESTASVTIERAADCWNIFVFPLDEREELAERLIGEMLAEIDEEEAIRQLAERC